MWLLIIVYKKRTLPTKTKDLTQNLQKKKNR